MKLSTDVIISAAKVYTKGDKRKPFTIDNIRLIAEKKGMDVKPGAWGRAMGRLQSERKIKPMKMTQSWRQSNHGRRVNVWRLA